MNKSIHLFSEEGMLNTSTGAKAASLIETFQSGFPVPNGFVLTTSFFELWMQQLNAGALFDRDKPATPAELTIEFKKISTRCDALLLDPLMRKELTTALDQLSLDSSQYVAVRSSTSMEDGDEEAFAGIFETELGVPADIAHIEKAIVAVFRSLWSERCLAYMAKNNLVNQKPGCAVIIQVQIPSDMSGVAFTLNPINNCYDELVINANFGLGESVVSGQVEPDQFIVNKINSAVIEKSLGKKEHLIRLHPEKGYTESLENDESNACLNESQIAEITALSLKLEELKRTPLDIEWAYYQDKLYLLQLRPVTAYVPLHPEMQTQPGKPKKLYLDSTLTTQGMNKATSILGTDYILEVTKAMLKSLTGSTAIIDQKNGFIDISHGRIYSNVSSILALPIKKKFIENFESLDYLTSETLRTNKTSIYRSSFPKSLPKFILSVILHLPRLLVFPVNIYQSFTDAQSYHQKMLSLSEKRLTELRSMIIEDVSPNKVFSEAFAIYSEYAFVTISAYSAAGLAKALLQRAVTKAKLDFEVFEQSLPHNPTTQMGLSMYEISQHPDFSSCISENDFLNKLELRDFCSEFLKIWDDFIGKYGFRVPMELDLATPRLYENLGELFRQLKLLSKNTEDTMNPRFIFNKGAEEREQTLEALLSPLSSSKKKRLRFYYNTYTQLQAYREIPKYFAIAVIDVLRQYVLKLADTWTKQGRLNYRDQIFDLNIQSMNAGYENTRLDLIEICNSETNFQRKLEKVNNFPRLIDSRGKILTPLVKSLDPNQLKGQPISSGEISGTVKVLTRPDEKDIEPGDILVTRATDPGWTPLFLNAAGIVLEVGGSLQHGAVVAREYNKPCIAGIDNALNIFQDGDLISMDGSTGLITKLNKA